MFAIKNNFPIFKAHPDLIFTDNASTTQKPAAVIEAISQYYREMNANVHRAVYDLGNQSDQIYRDTRQEICEFYQKETCIFTHGTTDGFNKLAMSLENQIDSRSNIIVTEMEHHSNLVPWQELCQRTGAELRLVGMTDEGTLDYEQMEKLMDDSTRIVSMVHISNTLGTINDLKRVRKIIGNRNAWFLVDAAQSCAIHIDLIQNSDADAYIFGGHKMFGPTGVGILLAKKKLLNELPPFHFGGGMVTEVETLKSEYKEDVTRFEAGTPPIAQIAGLKEAVRFISEVDLGQCRQNVSRLAKTLRARLEAEGFDCLGKGQDTAGIVSVTFGDIHPHDAASFLNTKNIAVRAGHHCTQLIMKKYGIQACVRFSFSIYNRDQEVDSIMHAIKEMKSFFS
ncbi:aminotransferase class V-fold PLP-dependent enzyme [Portibacter marinus]|uniref:aminotransferase class V-fold PLP-dependent enzyme n=1 Tax=Portibacter marinus TaxID=2898660 RepID=UPI001F3510B2|nr:cysteine desulfurase [Portibacter marinus]